VFSLANEAWPSALGVDKDKSEASVRIKALLQAHHEMRMHCRFAFEHRHVADQREHFHLLMREVRTGQVVTLCELDQAGGDLIAFSEDDRKLQLAPCDI
jgi:hypothetical protein